MKTIFLDTVVHQQKQIVLLKFAYDTELILRVKKITGAFWSQSLQAWAVPYVPDIILTLTSYFNKHVHINSDLLSSKLDQIQHSNFSIKNNQLNDNTQQKIMKFEQWLQSKRYAENTIKTYIEVLRTFLRFFNTKSVLEITNDDLINFNTNYILKNNYSASYQNQAVNAIKLFFATIENKKIEIDLIHRPRRIKLLPNVLSKEEVEKILSRTQNIKHKSMLFLIYSCGLRRSELLNLKLNDVDSKRGLLIIRQAKGYKDRVAPLSSKVVDLLRVYYKNYKPKVYLFEGQKGACKYSDRSLEEVLKKSIKLAGISKPVTLHWLRHSYATHLLERGTDLRYIQEILGHKSSKTTEIYTHVSTKQLQKITSPIDDLNL